MKNFGTILLNIIGIAIVLFLFFYIIKGEFQVNTPTQTSNKIINSLNSIDKEKNNTISSIRKKESNISSTATKISTPYTKKRENLSFEDIRNKRERIFKNNLNIREKNIKKSQSEIEHNDTNYIERQTPNRENNGSATTKVETNESSKTKEKNSTIKDNYYSPYVWAVNWPFKRESNQSNYSNNNFIEHRTIEERIDDIGGEMGDKVLIRIFKEEMKLELWMSITGEYKLLKTYPLKNFTGELGPKLSLRDRQAPEGYYSITINSIVREDDTFMKMDIGFPNKYDKEHNITSGYASIHNPEIDEDGFILTNDNISEIYNVVEASLLNGYKSISVYIYPFVMSRENIDKYSNSQWIDFWLNIKEGYDFFNKYHRTPKIEIREGRYIFHIL